MEQLKSVADLLDLHDIDLQIDRLLEDRGSLPELEVYKGAHEEVQRLSSALEEATAAQRQAQLSLGKANGELELTAEKAAAEQNRLYAGGISARDADYLRREVEMLYAKVSGLEDDVLVYMEQKDNLDAEIERLTDALAAANEEMQRLAGVIQDQWRLIDKELAAKEERKAAAIGLVDGDLLDTYESLRSRKDGRVVGRLIDGVCGACHLQLSAAEVSRISKEDPPRCIHCRAILVV